MFVWLKFSNPGCPIFLIHTAVMQAYFLMERSSDCRQSIDSGPAMDAIPMPPLNTGNFRTIALSFNTATLWVAAHLTGRHMSENNWLYFYTAGRLSGNWVPLFLPNSLLQVKNAIVAFYIISSIVMFQLRFMSSVRPKNVLSLLLHIGPIHCDPRYIPIQKALAEMPNYLREPRTLRSVIPRFFDPGVTSFYG